MLQINTRNLGTTTVLDVQGQIINGESDKLRKAVRSLSNVSSVKLDFRQVSVIDANGLGLLLSLREYAQSKGFRFELMNVTTQIRRVFEMTRLDTVFRITSSVEYLPNVTRRPVGMSPALRCA